MPENAVLCSQAIFHRPLLDSYSILCLFETAKGAVHPLTSPFLPNLLRPNLLRPIQNGTQGDHFLLRRGILKYALSISEKSELV